MAVLLFLFSLSTSVCAAEPVDITQVVLRETPVQITLNSNCDKLAAGNEKRCSLSRVTMETMSKDNVIRLAEQLTLQSRHVPTRGIVLYDKTASVNAHVDVDGGTCNIRDFQISSDNEIYQALVSLFQSEIRGQINRFLAQCQ